MKHHPLRTWLLAFTVMLSLLIGSAMALETPAPGKRLSAGQPSIQNLALYAAASSGDALHKALENVLPEVNNSLKDTNQKQIAYLELNGNTVTVNIIDENYPAMSMLQTQQFFNIIFNNADVKSMVQSLKFPALKNLKYGSDQSDAVIKPPVDAEVYKLKGKNIDNMLDSDQFNIMFRVAWITLYPNANNADEDNSYTVEKDLLKNKDMLIGRLLSAKVTKVTVLLSPPDGAFEDQEYVFHFKKADTYTASFVDADGKNLGTQTLMPGAKITFPAAPKGYTIEKWTDESGTAVDPENTTMGTENCTFTAHVTPITSHLTLECMGGTLPDGTQTPFPVTYDQPYNLPTPTRSGFYFGGWYQEHDAETDLYTAGLSGNCDITADSTVYAQWVLLVTCDLKEGGFSSGNIDNPVEVQKNFPYSLYTTFKAEPVRFKYVFGGWYVDENYETPIGTKCTLTGNENGEVTIYAKWVKKVTYTVTYDCCDEAFEDPQPEKSFTITVGEKYGTLPTPTRTGYNFKGWYADKDYKTAIATGETCLLSSSDGSTNVSIYAKWEPTSYPITYTLNGGTLSGEYKKTYTTEESFNLPIPTKLGYTFLGWTGDYISEGPKVDVNIPEGMFGECKYTANWERETYTITYKNVEVKLEGAPEEFTIESETFTLPEPTKTGYTFLGWKKDESSQAIKPVTIAKGSTGSRTYTAEWKAIEYPITYTLNGGILSGDYKKTYTIEETFHLPVPTKPGYTFEGWTGTDLYAPATEVNIPVKTSGPLSYTATWKVITYTVTCEPNEGTLTSEKIFTVDYDAKYSDAGLTDPTRPGYKFLGWCSDEGCTTLIGETCKLLPANESTNVTIYAKWEPLEATTYTIEYNLDGGTALTSPKTTYTVAETPFALPTTTKSGYTFVGWTVKIKESSKQIGASLTKIPEGTTGNLVCTANWSAPSSTRYDIQYELDGGAVTADSIDTDPFTIATGEQYPELPTLYRKGYQFKGWLLVQNEPDSKIEAGDICTVTANTTLYPYWVLESYKIEYPGLTKDEIAALGNPESYTMKDGNITLKNPSRKGYTFDGWTSAISSKLETTIIIETSKTTSDLQYTAHFTPITYNISYTGVEDSDWPSGGEITSYDITMTTSTPPLKLPNPFRSGLVFRGWTSTDLNISTPQRDYTIPAETIGNLTFTANWEAEQSITVVSSNSSDGNLTSVTVDFIYLGNQAQALCAFYDASGNLCEIQCKALSNTTSAASDTTTTQTWTFTANKTATSAKLFLLKDKSLQPVCPPKETQVQP